VEVVPLFVFVLMFVVLAVASYGGADTVDPVDAAVNRVDGVRMVVVRGMARAVAGVAVAVAVAVAAAAAAVVVGGGGCGGGFGGGGSGGSRALWLSSVMVMVLKIDGGSVRKLTCWSGCRKF
jgi:hypothetical protein